MGQALQIAERTAHRAQAAARKRGDMDTVNDIEDLLKFTLAFEGNQEGKKTTPTPTTVSPENIGVDEMMQELQRRQQGG